ncbi:MAG: hypothetical protein J1G38_02040 [Clostridiales bacterium]|nr:hypothetical protein [Clostridiales bacterium]
MRVNKKKLVELLILCAVAIVVVAVSLSVMFGSYNDYQAYYKASTKKPERAEKQVLDSIDAQLANGIEYFDNYLADVKNEHLVVTAHYTQGKNNFDEVLEPEKYSVSVPADFAVNGGTVTVKYKSKEATVDIVLTPVALVGMRIARAPFTIAYATGSTFSTNGMIVYAQYNDGSEKQITAADYLVDITTPLAKGATGHKLTYTEDGVTKEIEIPISVSDTVNNGAVKTIGAVEDCYAAAGSKLADVKPTLLITYESGNSLVIGDNDYTVTAADETVQIGKTYSISVQYSANKRVRATIPVAVRAHIEAETAKIVGGKTSSEASYTFEKGKFIPTGETPTFAGNFANAVKGGNEASLTITVDSVTDCYADITMYCGNSYIVRDDDGYYWMQPLKINTVLDLTINGEPVEISNDVVLKGCGPSETTGSSSSVYAPLYGVYYSFTFKAVKLSIGKNDIKFEFKSSTEGATTCWNESPSTMNIDWINVDAVGTEIPENPVVTAVEIVDTFKVEFGTDFDSLVVPVIGTLESGARFLLGSDLYTVTKPAGRAMLGKSYDITVALKSDASIKDTKTYTIEDEIKLEAEDAKFGQPSDGKIVAETANEYTLVEGDDGSTEWVPGDMVTVVKGMDWTATNKSECSLTFTFSAIEGEYALKIRCDNAYYFTDGDPATGAFYTLDCNLADVINVYVNGTKVSLDAEAVVPAIAMASDSTWYVFFELPLAKVHLNDGANTIVIEGNRSSTVKNKWKEISVPRIDWIKLVAA